MRDNKKRKKRNESRAHLKTFYLYLLSEARDARNDGYGATAPGLASNEEDKKTWGSVADGMQRAAQLLSDRFDL